MTDYNRVLVRDVYEAYVEDGFEHVHFEEVPRLAHDLPPVAWFDRMLGRLLSGHT